MDDKRFWILAAKKLTGELTPKEFSEWQTQLAVSPSHYEMYKSLEQEILEEREGMTESTENVLNNLRSKLSSSDPDFLRPLAAEVRIAEQKENKSNSFSYPTKLILVFFLLLVSTGAVWKILFKDSEGYRVPFSDNVINADAGSIKEIKLPDGSKVLLNAESKLGYGDFSDTREVSLEGEAFFDIADNKASSFTVHAGSMKIQATGTCNIKSIFPDQSEAILLSGSMQVIPYEKKEKIIVKPGQKVTVVSDKERSNTLSKLGARAIFHDSESNYTISIDNFNASSREGIKALGWTK